MVTMPLKSFGYAIFRRLIENVSAARMKKACRFSPAGFLLKGKSELTTAIVAVLIVAFAITSTKSVFVLAAAIP